MEIHSRINVCALLTGLFLAITPVFAQDNTASGELTVSDELTASISPMIGLLHQADPTQQVSCQLAITLPFEQLTETEEIIACYQSSSDWVIQAVEANLLREFGEETFIPAAYPVKVGDYSNGKELYSYDGIPLLDAAMYVANWDTVMYWYDPEQNLAIGMELTNCGSWYEWELELSLQPYKETSVDFAQLPFECSYHMEETEVGRLLEGLAYCTTTIKKGTEQEAVVYTVFLPEQERAEYVQLTAQSLLYLQQIGTGGRIPGGHWLTEVCYHCSGEADGTFLAQTLEDAWESEETKLVNETVTALTRYTETAVAQDWYEQVAASGVPAYYWRIYESIRLEKQIADHPILIYDGSAQSVLAWMEEWMGWISISPEEMRDWLDTADTLVLEWYHGSQVQQQMQISRAEDPDRFEAAAARFCASGYSRRNEPFRAYGASFGMKWYDDSGTCLGELLGYTPQLVGINGQIYQASEPLNWSRISSE